MIVLDLHQILYSTILAGIRDQPTIDEDYLRHVALNCIRSNNQKFRHQYGKLVIATDGSNSWRKGIFPYYKANRQAARDKSVLDWFRIFQIMATLREEIKEYLPYPIVHLDNAEADDIIAVLTQKFLRHGDAVLIISSDKDFVQLQSDYNVRQFDPIRKKDVVTTDPIRALKEHIIRGDSGDGIPNILSRDNVFVSKQRQNRLTKQRFIALMEMDPLEYDDENLRNFRRNEQLIDLAYVPGKLSTQIMEEYEKQENKDTKKLFKYFMDKQLKNLMESISDF
jgi:5'-3' exonuclease